ncbi:hypothetical protein Taro_028024 [Colocasia esculenta]|uniref:Uncharacterized protein n=1 Tax=Colocasia esculenta TaxID=4460 RepID=A0A843VG41_COLES|nr:hypothetical protein [Colocasia esculenta]
MPDHRDRGLNGCNHRSRNFRILPHLPCQPRELLIWSRMSMLVMRSAISELMSSLAELMRSVAELMRSVVSELMRSLAELMRSVVSELMRSLAELMRSAVSELMRSLAELMRSAVSELMRSLAELMRSLAELMRVDEISGRVDEIYGRVDEVNCIRADEVWLVAADLEGSRPAGMSPYHWPPKFTSGSGRGEAKSLLRKQVFGHVVSLDHVACSESRHPVDQSLRVLKRTCTLEVGDDLYDS